MPGNEYYIIGDVSLDDEVALILKFMMIGVDASFVQLGAGTMLTLTELVTTVRKKEKICPKETSKKLGRWETIVKRVLHRSERALSLNTTG